MWRWVEETFLYDETGYAQNGVVSQWLNELEKTGQEVVSFNLVQIEPNSEDCYGIILVVAKVRIIPDQNQEK